MEGKENGTGFSIEGMFNEKVILNKVDMDLKQLKDELVSEFKAMFAKEVKLAEWKTEVLVCIGTDDHMVSIEESERTAKQLKNGHLKIIEGFRHPLESVDKNILASICNEFFL